MSKKIIIPLLLGSLLLSSCGKTANSEMKTETPRKTITTEVAKSDYFTERVKLVGKIFPLKETTVSAQVPGIVKTINATVGKSVKKGDILATLDLSTTAVGANLGNVSIAYLNSVTAYDLTKQSTEKDLENARIVLENARTSKENTYTSTEKQLQIAQTQLNNVLTQMNNAKKTTNLSVELATKSRDQAKTVLENFEKTSKDTLISGTEDSSGLYSSTQVSMKNALIIINSALTQADIVLGVTNTNKGLNDGYETYLGAKNTALKSLSENTFNTVYKSYHTIVDGDNTSSGATDIRLSDIIALVKANISLYDEIISVLDNSITSSQFSQTSLDALKVTISAKQSILTQTDSSLVALSNSITTTRTSLETGLSIAETNLQNTLAGTASSLDGLSGNETLTRTQFENVIATVKSARDSMDNTVKIAEAQYDSARTKLQSQLTGAKSQLDASKGQKDIANIQAENGLIRAPFDGIILTKQVELGTLVSPGTPLFNIGDDNSLIIRTDMNSDIIGSLKIGQEVVVTKDLQSFTGITSLLAPGSDTQTRMFRAEAIFQDTTKSKETFHIGDFVDIYLSRTNELSKSITIPFSALTSDGQGGFTVYIVGNNNIAQSKAVKIGTQNESRVEILEGLSEGDKVVISGALNLQEGDGIIENGEGKIKKELSLKDRLRDCREKS